jgi:hypothetical protein
MTLGNELKQNTTLIIALATFGGLILGLVTFFNNREHIKMQKEVLALDKQMKEFQLDREKKASLIK